MRLHSEFFHITAELLHFLFGFRAVRGNPLNALKKDPFVHVPMLISMENVSLPVVYPAGGTGDQTGLVRAVQKRYDGGAHDVVN